MPTKLEMEQQIADLRRELQCVQEAKEEAEERAQQRISGLEAELSTEKAAGQQSRHATEESIASLTAEVEAVQREAELQIVRGQERVRQELDEAHRRELNTHLELQRVLQERVAEKDMLIADLRSRLERAEQQAVLRGVAPSDGRGVEFDSSVEDHEGRSRAVLSRSMKLPPLPEFAGSDSLDEGAYQRWLLKLEKHAQL